MFNLIWKGRGAFCIRGGGTLLRVHISHIVALTHYAISLCRLCGTLIWQQTLILALKHRCRVGFSLSSGSVGKTSASINCCRMCSLLNIRNFLHYYIQKQTFRGQITVITPFLADRFWKFPGCCHLDSSDFFLQFSPGRIWRLDLNHFHKGVSGCICCLTSEWTRDLRRPVWLLEK